MENEENQWLTYGEIWRDYRLTRVALDHLVQIEKVRARTEGAERYYDISSVLAEEAASRLTGEPSKTSVPSRHGKTAMLFQRTRKCACGAEVFDDQQTFRCPACGSTFRVLK